MIVFRPLGREELLKVLGFMLQEVSRRLAEQGIHIEISDEAMNLLLEKGYDPRYGARPLRRAVQRMIEDRLADLMLEGRIHDQSRVMVSVQDGELLLEPLPEPEAEPEGPADEVPPSADREDAQVS